MANEAAYIGRFRDELVALVPEMGTRPRVLWKPQAVSGASVIGSRVHAIYASSSDAGANTLHLLRGKMRTTQGGATTGAMAITATTITRASGSFLSDGWRVGMRCVLEEVSTAGNQALATVTGVAALTLTFAAATFPTAEPVLPGVALIQVGQAAVVGIPAGSGFGESPRTVPLLTSTSIPSLALVPDTCTLLGPSSCLLVRTNIALDAGEVIEVMAEGGDY